MKHILGTLALGLLLFSGGVFAQTTSIIPDCVEPLPFSCPAQNYVCWFSDDVINRCEIGIGWTSHAVGSGGGGAVTSVFGRTGVVSAAQGDYSHSELSNIGNSDHHTPSSECASFACDLNASTLLGGQGVCLLDGTNCPTAPGGSGNMVGPGVSQNDQTVCFLDTDGLTTKVCTKWDFTGAQDAGAGVTVDASSFVLRNNASITKTARFILSPLSANQAYNVRLQNGSGLSNTVYMGLWADDPDTKTPGDPICPDANGYLTTTACNAGGGTGTPGGNTTEVQYNLAGAFAGSPEFTFVAGQPLHVDNGYKTNPTLNPGMAFDVLNTDLSVDFRFHGTQNGGTAALPDIDVRIASLKAGVEQDWLFGNAASGVLGLGFGSGNGTVSLPNDAIGPLEVDKNDSWDFSNAAAFSVPISPSRALPVAGEVLVDTDENQFIYNSGGAEHVIVPDEQLCMRYDDLPAGSTSEAFFSPNRDVIAISAWCICNADACTGTPPALTFGNRTIDIGGGLTALTGAPTTCNDRKTNVVPQSTTGTILGGDQIEFSTNAHGQTGLQYMVCLSVKYVRK